jgi:hypothetical protein
MGAKISTQATRADQRRAPDASTEVHARQAESPMTTRPEIERRLAELAAEIEQEQTRIWLAEHQREQLRHELRRAIHAEEAAK